MKNISNVTVKWSYIATLIIVTVWLSACATPEPNSAANASLPFYRCEHDISFTAKFDGDAVRLDSSRGYDILFARSKAEQDKQGYSNPRMTASFGLGSTGREAQLRYPLLPLIARCVRDN